MNCNVKWTKNKEKEAGIGPFLEKCSVYLYLIHRPFYLKTPLAIRGDGFSGTGAALESPHLLINIKNVQLDDNTDIFNESINIRSTSCFTGLNST